MLPRSITEICLFWHVRNPNIFDSELEYYFGNRSTFCAKAAEYLLLMFELGKIVEMFPKMNNFPLLDTTLESR